MYKLYKSVILPTERLVWENSIIQIYIFGYFCSVILGWLILQLPLCQNNLIPALDVLFTAASALSTSGLATIDIGQMFAFSGQLILLLLIQLGGLGYMIVSSFILLNIEQRTLDFRKKVISLPASLSRDFTMTELIKKVIAYTFLCEMAGVVQLYLFFRQEQIENPLWNALFHSISAFCTTGLSLFSSNLEGFQNHLGINISFAALNILGAFGFFFWSDFFKKKMLMQAIFRMTRSVAAIMILVGTTLFLLATFRTEGSLIQKLVIAFFQTTSAFTTAGFNTVNLKTAPVIANVFLLILMLSGASITARCRKREGLPLIVLLKLCFQLLVSKKRDRKLKLKLWILSKKILNSTYAHFIFVLFIFYSLLTLFEKQWSLSLLFETASALCTAGLSMGVTSNFSVMGESLLILLMLIGRKSILIYGFLAYRHRLEWKRTKVSAVNNI